ncbi:DUF5677 domain-containing protein [Cellulomonas shaoxiangyii]|uniref:Uncharacterized protein n=1 Tax=Cellulomonas shaoxiangyii TaxID=2566013 RepID=A0A4P7SPV1_9CELL|nr:DUF5677 domain-containing protein [Cellulomonas shaoxiangyii]QCB95034.1 hypothetical protein E5225_17160 [Cellulomonas shaoxiangyii]TGY86363.1 hypothetical protein E5226_02245 [Cellulomonas shaoxiangyii]
MSPPEDAEFRAIARELIDLWHTGVAEGVRVNQRESPLIGLVVYALHAHAVNLAESVLTLYERDLGHASVALIRQLVECAFTAVWIERFGQRAAGALLHEEARSRRWSIQTFLDLGVVDDARALDDAIAALDELESAASPPGRTFQGRCEDFENGLSVYAIYRALSQFSHAGTATTQWYVHDDGTGARDVAPWGLAVSRTPTLVDVDDWFRIVPVMLVHSGLAWDRLDGHHHARTRLKQLAQHFRITVKNQPSARGLQNERDREKKAKAARKSRRTPGA